MTDTHKEQANLYEAVVIHTGLNMQHIKDITDYISLQPEGKVDKLEHWGVRTLYNKPKNHSKGHVTYIEFQLLPKDVQELNTKINRLGSIVLHSLMLRENTTFDHSDLIDQSLTSKLNNLFKE